MAATGSQRCEHRATTATYCDRPSHQPSPAGAATLAPQRRYLPASTASASRQPETSWEARSPGGRAFAVLALARVEPARRPANDLVPVVGHPEFQPGMTGFSSAAGQMRVQCGLPSAPTRTRSSVSIPSPDSGARLCSSSTREDPYRPEPGPDAPSGLGDGRCEAGLGDDGQVARRRGRGRPDTHVRDAFPGQASRRVPPERVVKHQLSQRRQAVRRGGRQRFHPSHLASRTPYR